MELRMHSWLRSVLAFVLFCSGCGVSGVEYGNVNIDLDIGKVTGYSEQIQFIVPINSKETYKKCSHQAVARLTLNLQKTKVVSIDLKYRNPKQWTFHLSDSISAEGFDFTSSNETSLTQVQALNQQLRVYNKWPSPYTDTKFDFSGIGSSFSQWMWMTAMDSSIMRHTHVNFSLKIHRNMLQVYDGRLAEDIAVPPGLLYKNNELKNETVLYIAMNRIISGPWRSGTGLCQVKIRLKDDSDHCSTSEMNCDVNAECKPTRKSYRCSCKKGWEGDGRKCKDINECKLRNGGCVHVCRNTAGSYSCTCLPGFKTDPFDPHNCIDINECEQNNGGCEQQCINTVGSYKCACLIDGSLTTTITKHCPIDPSVCVEHGCDHNCKFSNGQVDCICKEGYYLNTTDQKSCIRSCRIGNGGCQHHCLDSDTGVVCTCQYNYLLGHDSTTCTASCSVNNGGCQKRCTNTDVGVNCSCPNGYILNEDGKTCSDINECAVNNGNCEHKCVNSVGGYECVCPAGYKLNATDELSCVDLDECSVNRTCEHTCINTPGSFYCTCNQGYQLYGVTHCGDINECAINNGGCQKYCVNTGGGFHCTTYNNFTSADQNNFIGRSAPVVSVKFSYSGINCSYNDFNHTSDEVISVMSQKLFSKCSFMTTSVECLDSKKVLRKFRRSVVRVAADVNCTLYDDNRRHSLNYEDLQQASYNLLVSLKKNLRGNKNLRLHDRTIKVLPKTFHVMKNFEINMNKNAFLMKPKLIQELPINQSHSTTPCTKVMENCDIGEFWDDGTCSCELCPQNTYQNASAQKICIPCPGNSGTDTSGSVDISDCKSKTCGGVMDGLQGYIESPNYPGNYPNNVECVWKIKAVKNRRVLFIVSDLNLADEKCGDSLVIRKSKSPYSVVTFEACKTLEKPVAFVAHSKKLWIQFKSNNESSSKGFHISIVSYNEDYHGLIEDIVQDSRLYASPNHLDILKDQQLLDALMEVIVQPVNYYKYANNQRKMFPNSFIRLLTPKVKKFFS